MQVERHESGAVGERLKRPWEEQWAKGPEVSVNLHWWPRRSALQVSNFEAAGRARTLKLPAPLQVECHESGAFGERFKRPWEEQWAKGAEVSVNLHWWSRRFAVQKSSVNRDS